jgi:phosphinothricin acetyltransferase
MTATIRLASPDDAAAILEIYRPFCESTAISFEYAAPSLEEIAARIHAVGTRFPWLVLVDDDVIAGYAYANRHRERAGYAWSVDSTVYVGPTHRRRRVGTALYTALFHLLRRQGYFKVYAGITLPNDASTGMHQALGFTLVGVYEGVGYKFGAWHDVAHYQLALQPERADPDPPTPVSRLTGSPDWADAVSEGLRRYRRGGPNAG